MNQNPKEKLITLEDDVDLKVDIVFKKVFGSPDHANITLSLLNSIL